MHLEASPAESGEIPCGPYDLPRGAQIGSVWVGIQGFCSASQAADDAGHWPYIDNYIL